MSRPSKRASLIALVERYFETLGRLDDRYHRDLDATLALLDDNIVYCIPFHETPLHWRGKAALRPFLESMQGLFSDIRYVFGNMVVDTGRQTVVVEVSSQRMVRSAGVLYSNSYVFVFILRRKRIAVLHEYANPGPAKAIEHLIKFNQAVVE